MAFPVATVAVNAAQNAGILAAQIIGSSNTNVLEKIIQFKTSLSQKVEQDSKKLREK